MSDTTSPKPQQTLSERVARLDPDVLTTNGRNVLLTAANLADRYTGQNLWTSATALARWTGLARSTVEEALTHLHRIGALVFTPDAPRLPGYDRRLKGRAIVVAHLPGAPREPRERKDHTARRGDPESTSTPPGGKDHTARRQRSHRQAVSTVPSPSSSSKTQENRPKDTHPQTPVGGSSSNSSQRTPDRPFEDRLNALLESLLVASGPVANRRWVALARSNPNVRCEADLLRVIKRAVELGREAVNTTINYASDARPWAKAWSPDAKVFTW